MRPSRAQALADHLRAEVEAEVVTLRAEASATHDEARRLLVDASRVQRSAQARLQETQQESAQLVADAADQATLVADAASRTSENLLAKTQAEADETRSAAEAESLRPRGLATTELEQARESNTALLSEAAAHIESRQMQVTAELRQLSEEASQHVASVRAAAEESCRDAISRANAEANAMHATTMQELDQARTETAALRSTTAAEIESARDAATAKADHVLGDAADHIHWAQDTARSVLLAAEAEAVRSRDSDHAASAAHLAARRRQLQDVISHVALRVRTTVAEGAAEAERLRAQANAVLEASDKDTIARRKHAQAHTERVITEADLTAQAGLERAQRRLGEAEAGARVLRE
jgi:hypothetical protein